VSTGPGSHSADQRSDEHFSDSTQHLIFLFGECLSYLPPNGVSSLLCAQGDISSVTGPCWSIPLSHDPVAGVFLLSGVGAWPPPDGVG
jgi:hypothetical protein